MLECAGDQLGKRLVEGAAGGRQLLGDRLALLLLGDHALDAADLSLDPRQTVDEGLLVLFGDRARSHVSAGIIGGLR